MKRILEISFLLSIFSLFMLSCASNSTKNNGSVASDDDVRAMFENHEFVSEYNYFYTVEWRTKYPMAIVGINKDYELVKDSSGLHWTGWLQFEPGSEKLKELVELISAESYGIVTSYGFIIYAPGGEDQIGIMYTRKAGADMPEIQFKDGNLIAVKPVTFDLSGSGAP